MSENPGCQHEESNLDSPAHNGWSYHLTTPACQHEESNLDHASGSGASFHWTVLTDYGENVLRLLQSLLGNIQRGAPEAPPRMRQ